jgi:FkbM family methyltransferase
MNLPGRIKTLLTLAEDMGTIRALLTWPKFSVTSYFMVTRLLKQGIAPRTVIDVGANVGQFAVASAKLFSGVRVHSFEPVPGCVEELRKNVAGLKGVTVYPLALGEKAGEARLRVNAYTHASSFLPITRMHREAFPKVRESGEVPVEVSTLDRVFSGVELPGPVLLKLDVQGYEEQVIWGGAETLRRVDYVVLEASFRRMYEGEPLFADLMRLMEDHGFRFERPVGWLTAPGNGEVLQMDALFAREG